MKTLFNRVASIATTIVFTITLIPASALQASAAEQASSFNPASPDAFGKGTEYNDLFRRPRPPLLKDMPVERTLKARDLGIVPDDTQDDRPALQKAFDAIARQNQSTRLLFEKGVYDLTAPSAKEAQCLLIENVRNLIVDGAGATFMIHSPHAGWGRIKMCQNIILRDFTVDCDPLPFTQGFIETVTADPPSFTVRIADGFPTLDEKWFRESDRKWIQIRDKANPLRNKTGGRVHINAIKWERVGDRLYRQTTTPRYIPLVAPGDPFVQTARMNGNSIFNLYTNNTVTLMRVTAHASPGGFCAGQINNALALLGCKTLCKPGRWATANADAIHQIQASIGPWVEGCVFEGIGDDISNYKVSQFRLGAVVGPNRYRLEDSATLPATGHLLIFFDPVEGKIIGEAKAVESKKLPGKVQVEVTVDAPIAGVRPGKGKDATFVYDDDLACESFVFRNNVFRLSRRYGNLVRAHDGVIEGNTYEGLPANAVCVTNEASWPEGLFGRNLVIRNNTIRDCGWELVYLEESHNAAAIAVSALKLDKTLSSFRGLDNIRILNNRIDNWQRHAIFISGGKNIAIEGNEITGKAPLLPLKTGSHQTIGIRNSTGVRVTKNKIADTRAIQETIAVDSSTADGVTVKDNTVD